MTALGPGALVAVVGPSGAGKDTLLDVARELVRDVPEIVFPRRVVTRTSGDGEDHDSITREAFDTALGRGGFAFWWEAHGLRYGIPAAVNCDIAARRTVVCNVSRAVVPDLRRRYAACLVVWIDAPREVRAARLAARRRASDGDLECRLDRAAANSATLTPDAMIDNIGTPLEGGRALASLILRAAAPSSADCNTIVAQAL